MTSPLNHSTTARAGKHTPWFATCSCGWFSPCTGGEDATQRMTDHRRVARALALLPPVHDCVFAAEMELGPSEDCRHCQLEPVLKGRAVA